MNDETQDSDAAIMRLVGFDVARGASISVAEVTIGDGHTVRVQHPADEIEFEIQIQRFDGIGPERMRLSLLEAKALYGCLAGLLGRLT